MFVLRRLPACLALLMLGALSLRLGLGFLAALLLTLLLMALLFIPRAIPQTIASAVMWGGSIAWLGMAWLRIQQRLGEGLPWMRLALMQAQWRSSPHGPHGCSAETRKRPQPKSKDRPAGAGGEAVERLGANFEEFRIWPERFIDFRKKISQDARDKGNFRLAADPLHLLHPG